MGAAISKTRRRCASRRKTDKSFSNFKRRLWQSVPSPNCGDLGLENTKIQRDDRDFIKVNAQQQTTDPDIYAIGDVAGGMLLAHKASREARVAVEVITGEGGAFQDVVIPAVVFTEPEI